MKNKIAAVTGPVAFAAILAGFIYAAPYWTLHHMQATIVDKDVRAFSHGVDLPAVRRNTVARMRAGLRTPMQRVAAQMKRYGASDADVDAWRKVLPIDELMQLIGDQVSIQSIASFMATGDVSPAWPAEIKPAQRDMTLTYRDWNRIVFTPKSEPEGHGFVFERNGLWGWKLVDLDFEMNFASQ